MELSVGCSRDILVPHFIKEGYKVTYNEFMGIHEVPDYISENTINWFLGDLSDN